MSTKKSSMFGSDPDRAHDKKLAGLAIDEGVGAEKEALRQLRDAIDATVRLYTKYGEKQKRGFTLTLPELAAWSQHEAFVGGEDASATIFRDVAQLTATEKLAKEMRASISGMGEAGKSTGKPSGVSHLKLAARCVAEALQVMYGYELMIRNATSAQADATKRLAKAKKEAEAAGAKKEAAANPFNDAKKQAAALKPAEERHARAEAELAEATETLTAADAELKRFVDKADAVVDAGKAARATAEATHLVAAADAVLCAYEAFGKRASDVLEGKRLVLPVVKKKKARARLHPSCAPCAAVSPSVLAARRRPKRRRSTLVPSTRSPSSAGSRRRRRSSGWPSFARAASAACSRPPTRWTRSTRWSRRAAAHVGMASF